jgi:hypothetical protein
VLERANGGIGSALDIPLAEFRLRRASAIAMHRHGVASE